MKSFSYLLGLAKGSKGKLAGSVILSVISIVSGIVPYFCFYKVIDAFIEGMTDVSLLVKWCLVAAVAYVVKVVAFGLSTGLSHHMAYHILEQLRLRVADRFLHAPLGEVTAHSIGEIKSVMVDKIEDVEPPLAHMVPEGAGHVVLPVVSIICLVFIDWRLALASLITVPLSFVCMMLTFQISGKNFEKYVRSNEEMNSNIVEYVEGIEVIKAFGRTGTSYKKYASSIRNYKTFIVEWLSSTWVTMKLAFALFPSTLLGVLPVGLWLGANGTIPVAQVALAVMLSMSMVVSLAKLEVFSESIREMSHTVEKLQIFLNMPALPEPDNRVQISNHDVTMNKVRFSYTGEKEQEVLHGIDLELTQGSFTALVGPSGGGKSTVAKLLARFWDVTDGEIRIGGANIKEIPLSQLADMVSFVTQDNFLFRCSILENIRLGNPKATDEEVYEAARAAQCEDFIRKLPQGYQTSAGEAGKRLSGGEKQRIAIARMMLKNAPIVILDEATAFTDPENEDKIQRSIAELTKGKTLLVIAHRLSTIKNADQIVVLQDGNILAQGNQEELLANCPLYGEALLAIKQACKDSKDISLKIEWGFIPSNCLHLLALKIASAALAAAACYLGLTGQMAFSEMLVFVFFSFSIFGALEPISDSAHILGVINNAMNQLEALQTGNFIDSDGKDIALEKYDISFEKVDFGYDSRKILKEVSFTIPEKTTTAIVGPSGSGKTTICNLLARFYDVNGGRITVGGHDVREFTCDSLLSNISMVFQNVYLFHDTIRNNICFGKPDTTEAEMIEAAKKACCHEFIMALPDGYDTVIGEGGNTLSGGEKQRISIARAMLKDAPIIILDEATASIDPENEHLIQSAISELTRGKTIITIAHRLATIEHADQILVLDDGKLVQAGTHKELIEQKGRYRDFIQIREKAEGWSIT